MRFELFLGLRYFRGKRKNLFVSVITFISVAGVSVGVMALVVVLAVMTGFDEELRAKTLGNSSHMTIERAGGLADYETLIRRVESDESVVAAAPYIDGMALLQSQRGTTGATVLGIDPERQARVTDLEKSLRGVEIEPGGIVLGSVLAQSIGIYQPGDTVTVVTSRTYETFLGSVFARKQMKVSGIFHSEYYKFDSLIAMMSLADAQKLFGHNDTVTGLQLKVVDPFNEGGVKDIKRRLADALGPMYRLTTWIEMDQAFFNALKTEKTVMFIILMFIVLVAAFNIVSTLIMVVMEKTRDIGILRTVGTPSTSIMMVFMIEGLVTGLIGTVTGLIGGVLVSRTLNSITDAVASVTGFELFPAEMYAFDRIPVKIVPTDLVWVVAVSIILSFAATIYPAWQAAHVDPVESLRND
jgi:lipoprotein-releasing system permease protein